MKTVLVIGASGFVGGVLSRALLTQGYGVRCLARTPGKVQDLAALGCEIVQGDILDRTSIDRALESVQAVYVLIHTLSPQPGDAARLGFMELELAGLQAVAAACRAQGVTRLVYVTFLGVTPHARSAWTRGRWRAEQFLLQSGLDITVLRPGQVVGVGGTGFDMMLGQARRSLALVLAGSRQKWRNIAVDDLVYYLVGVLDDPHSYGRCYDVGCDDVLTMDQMIDIASGVLGRRRPAKIHLPRALVRALAPVVERLAKLPKGAFGGLIDGLDDDMVGDPLPIRQRLPRAPLSYRDAVERALSLAASAPRSSPQKSQV